MLPGHYILDASGEPLRCDDLMTWGRFMENRDARVVKQDTLPTQVLVSTVFLGLDHQFGNGAPLFWETMIFGGPHDQYQDRYSSREEAVKGHERALAIAKGELQEEGA